MSHLPARPDLAQLRRQAKDLLRAARSGQPDAVARIAAVSADRTLAAAQLATAREYGFASWPRLAHEVTRRDVINRRDLGELEQLLARWPELAVTPLTNWEDHRGLNPLGYVSTLGFEHERLGLPASLPRTGELAAALLDAGAPVDGAPGESETPLMTAASYGDLAVARVLVEAGADLDARAAEDSGGVPGGTALMHAAVFGMTKIVDLLAAAGARCHGIECAAAVGDVTGWLTPDTPLQARLRALGFAADHERLAVIDELVAAGTPVDEPDEAFGRQALRLAARSGRPRSVRRLLEHGADPNRRGPDGLTALDHARAGHGRSDSPGHDEVERILGAVTAPPPD